jgi:hypothetical protein
MYVPRLFHSAKGILALIAGVEHNGGEESMGSDLLWGGVAHPLVDDPVFVSPK